MVVKPRFADALSFSEGLAAVRPTSSSGWAYIDTTGKVLFQTQFPDVSSFSEGLALVFSSSPSTVKSVPQLIGNGPAESGYIDKTGALVIKSKFNEADDFSGGLAAARTVDGDFGFIDNTGAFVVPPKYFGGARFGGPEAFSGALTKVYLSIGSGGAIGLGQVITSDYAYIDKTGKVVWRGQESSH